MKGVEPKSPERLAEERSQIEQLVGDQLYQVSERAIDLGVFQARSYFAAEGLRAIRRGTEGEFDSQESRFWLSRLSALQTYITGIENDPAQTSLRPGQVPIMREIVNFFERDAMERMGGRVVLPTSTGKTVLFTDLIYGSAAHTPEHQAGGGLRTLIVVPTKELIGQTRAELEGRGHGRELDIGAVHSGEKRPGKDVTVTTYASLNRFANDAPEGSILDPKGYQLVIYDEVHNLLGPQISRATKAFPHAIQIGFTATDKYSEEKQVSNLLPYEIVNWDIIKGQDERLVAPHQVVLVRTHTDMRLVPVASTGEYEQDILYETINTDKRNQAVIDAYQQLFPGKKTIAFCAGVEHAKHLAKKMRENGIAAEAIDGKMTDAHRQDIIKRFKAGSAAGGLDVVTNDRVLSTGFSEVSVEVALMVAATLSPLKLMQSAGRSTRLWDELPGKVGYVVQCVDDNYSVPPIIYAEEVASGHARHGWEGFEFPDIDTDNVTIPGVEIIADSAEVTEIAQQFADEREEIWAQLPPPMGWLRLDDVADRFRVPRKSARNALNRAKNARERKADQLAKDGLPTDHLFDFEANRGNFLQLGVDSARTTYVSPELVEQAKEYLNEYRVVPSPLWRTADDLAILYGRSTAWVKGTLMGPVNATDHEGQYGKFVSSEEDRRSRLFYSPDLVSKMARRYREEDFGIAPPATWRPESLVRTELGDEAYDLALERIRHTLSYYHQGKLNFLSDTRPQVYCTPGYKAALEFKLLHRPVGSGLNTKLTDAAADMEDVGVTVADLEHELLKLIQKEPGLRERQCAKFFDEGRQLVYYCSDQVIAHIREQAIRTRLGKVMDEEELEGHVRQKEYARAQRLDASTQPDTTDPVGSSEAPLISPEEIDEILAGWDSGSVDGVERANTIREAVITRIREVRGVDELTVPQPSAPVKKEPKVKSRPKPEQSVSELGISEENADDGALPPQSTTTERLQRALNITSTIIKVSHRT